MSQHCFMNRSFTKDTQLVINLVPTVHQMLQVLDITLESCIIQIL